MGSAAPERRASAVAAALIVVGLLVSCGRLRALGDAVREPTPTATPSWVGRIQESATPVDTFQSRVAAIEPLTGRPISGSVALREGPGRGAEPTGEAVQPGERIFIVGAERAGNERFFKVRTFDGLRRGWLSEAQIAAEERPPP